MLPEVPGGTEKSQSMGPSGIKQGLPGLMGRGTGMSTREKARFKEMDETLKRVLTTQTRIDT